jgi:hypothetical protein
LKAGCRIAIGNVVEERLKTDRRIVRALDVVKERASANGRVVGAASVGECCTFTVSGVGRTGSIA